MKVWTTSRIAKVKRQLKEKIRLLAGLLGCELDNILDPRHGLHRRAAFVSAARSIPPRCAVAGLLLRGPRAGQRYAFKASEAARD
jgi:hypothetical protein